MKLFYKKESSKLQSWKLFRFFGFFIIKSAKLIRFSRRHNLINAFTLIELIISISVLALLIAGSLPLAISFYNTRSLDVQEKSIVQALRRAQLKSIFQDKDSSFGVYISSGKYVLFKGNSYTGRDPAYDEVFDLPKNISTSGLSEVVFSKLSGIPLETGNIILKIANRSGTIVINKAGVANY